ncbi:MAG: nucleoside deaminase [Lachnospiraceae bacterium]|nr:nucleoside deaminase [Lachnospiraceae bacterium]
MRAENEYMQLAIDEARKGIHAGDGGPFGSVIVKDGNIIATGHNTVLRDKDSTAHGEINAIRAAEQILDTYDLSGCELYTTGEPCPMCLAACMWANIDKVYYGCTIDDNEDIGFRDAKFDRMMGSRTGLGDYLGMMDRDACLELFDEYKSVDAVKY